MYFGHWEPLGVSESCRTRIPGWSNPRVYWTDAVAFRCTWEHLGAPATFLGAPRITVEQSGKNNIFFGTAAGAPGNHSYYLSFKTNVFSLYSHLCIYVSIWLPIYTRYIWTGCRRCLRAIRGAPENDNRVNLEIHSEAVIERVWRCI